MFPYFKELDDDLIVLDDDDIEEVDPSLLDIQVPILDQADDESYTNSWIPAG